MKINRYTPKILQQYIEAFKVYHFEDSNEVQLYPKGVFEMVFQSQESFQHKTNYSSGWKCRPRSFIGGLHNKSYLVNPGLGQNSCIAVEFKAHTAKYFIPEKLHVFQNTLIGISDIWGEGAKRLVQKMDREKSDRFKIDHIEEFLFHRLIRPKQTVIDRSLEAVIQSKGFVEVNDLARFATLSTAQFRRRFKEEVGIAPSQYCKIVRVNSSLSTIKNKKHNTLTEITYDLGYFDQSHFIRDFKSVMGQSPKSFFTK